MASTVTQIGLTNSASSLASSLAVSGLASGMDWQTTVTELANAERAPETQWKQQQTTLNNQSSAFSTIATDLTTLQTDLQNLQNASLYSGRSAQSSDSSVASASAGAGTNIGTYSFNITRLATAAQINGASGMNAPLSSDGNLNNVTIGTAGFSTPVTGGTFTINGKQITIATTDSLQDVFQAISDATNGEVTASYDSTATDDNFDKITITDHNGNDLVLGSASDTSNFLQVARLYNSASAGTTITSTAKLGSVQLNAALTDSDLQTAVHGDTTATPPSTAGSFSINNVTINYDTSTDSLQNVLDRINSSSAGVTVTFDSQNNRFLLTNNSTGNVGITLHNITGNFLDAIGLTSGSFTAGQNLQYTLNGGTQQFTSLSNTIGGDSSGIAGLSLTAAQTGSVSVTVSTDTSALSSAIQQFVNDYNSVQSFISAQTIVTTASDGTVTPGTLTGDLTASDIVSNLRSLSFAANSGASSIHSLADLGVTTNGQDNSATLNTAALNQALAKNLSAVQAFFTDSKNGLATQLGNYLNDTIGGNNSATVGTLTQHQTNLSNQNTDLTKQISNLETKITSDTQHWTTEFQAMEQAQAQVNQELTYLSEQVTNGTL